MVKCKYYSFEEREEMSKPINYITDLLSRKSKDNTPICLGLAKWEGRIKYVDLYYDLNDEKYKNADRIIHPCSECKISYDDFNKLYEIFKPYLYCNNYVLGYFSIIPPTDKKEVNKLNKQIKKALG